MKKLKACLEIIRPVNSSMIGFAVLVGIALANKGSLPETKIVALGFLTGFFISSASMVLNDIADVEIDKVNAPQRPIPSGRLSEREATYCYIVTSVLGLIASSLISYLTLLIAAFSWTIATLYDLYGKKKGLYGNLMVAYSVGVPIIFGAACVNRFSPIIWMYYFMIFMTALAREIVKDIADVEGDKLANVESVALLKGKQFASRLSALFYISAVLVSPLPLIKHLVNPLAYGLPVLVVDIGLLCDSALIVKNPNKDEALRHKRRVLFYMLLGLIGFYLGVRF